VTHVIVPDPCASYLGHGAKGAALQACRIQNGFNLPLTTQFVHYASGLLSGNWGTNPANGQPVLPAILQAFPATLELVLASLFLMIAIGIPLGVIAANHSGRWADHFVRIFYLSGWATPTYLGGLLVVLFVMPFFGLSNGEFSSPPTFPQPTHMSVLDALLAGNLPATGDALVHLFFPALALAFLNMGIATRMTRNSMLEVLPLDFVKTARMKGLAEFWVLYKHALRNSLITTTTILGLLAGGLLSGTVIIEEIFLWPGIGQYALNSLLQFNYPGTIAVVVVFAIGVVVANLIADVVYGLLDPRVEWR
jgi:peptide/nickel transport system permease protein